MVCIVALRESAINLPSYLERMLLFDFLEALRIRSCWDSKISKMPLVREALNALHKSHEFQG